jgi:cation-transporting ATPase E
VLAGKKLASDLEVAQAIAKTGKRVLSLVETSTWPSETLKLGGKIPDDLTPIATVVLSEKIRATAKETLRYFEEQGVDIKIISGDSPLTVAAVAKAVGLKHVAVFDARKLPDPEKNPQKLLKIVEEHTVFGRVKPEQKRAIAKILQQNDHTVAMTGDGVNDALALKEADLGIAMNSGSTASKAVAEIVLLDNDFAHLPYVVNQGRRVIANIERVAHLFVIKNVYVLVLALLVSLFSLAYPFLPAQMTVISTLSIGVPAFFLAFAANQRKYVPGFLRRVLSFALPVGAITAIAMMVTDWLLLNQGFNEKVTTTAVSIVVMLNGLAVLILLSRPWKAWKLWLIGGSFAAFVGVLSIPWLARMFQYQVDLATLPWTLTVGAVAAIMTVATWKLTKIG